MPHHITSQHTTWWKISYGIFKRGVNVWKMYTGVIVTYILFKYFFTTDYNFIDVLSISKHQFTPTLYKSKEAFFSPKHSTNSRGTLQNFCSNRRGSTNLVTVHPLPNKMSNSRNIIWERKCNARPKIKNNNHKKQALHTDSLPLKYQNLYKQQQLKDCWHLSM